MNNLPKKKIKIRKIIITKFFLSIIVVLLFLIFINLDKRNEEVFKDKFFSNSLSFTKFNSWYTNYFGTISPTLDSDVTVFSSEFTFFNKKDYYDGEAFEVASNYLISNFVGGVVVFIGEKENFGNTIIIQGNDGYDIWYGNLENINVKIYDYIKADTILGECSGSEFYLMIKKNDETFKYEDYKN